MRDVSGKFVPLGFISRKNEMRFFGRSNDAADGVAFFGNHPKTLTKALIGHVIAKEVAKTGMEVAGFHSFLGSHRLEIFVSEEDSPGMQGCGLKARGGELEDFGLVHDLVNAGAALFANADAAHE